MQGQSIVTTYLFTDIEGSTRLWENEPEHMRSALAFHDATTREVVQGHRGVVVKMTGDGVLASFVDPFDAVAAAIELQKALARVAITGRAPLMVRCGLHAGVAEYRDNDLFGPAVNRAARIMSIAHGGQVLVSQAVAVLLDGRLPFDVSLQDLGPVRLRDLSTVERVHQVLHPELRKRFPALRSLESTPNNLPQQSTSFIGRDREIADAKKQLGTARLLTLVGAGGIGKTRLSLQVAAEVLEQYPEGVWFVELAPLNDGALVSNAAASVLGIMEEVGGNLTEALIRHVADRRLLLVLDNCEHVVEACATLAAQLLKYTPHARILASSREPLRVPGEVCFPVQALEVPESRDARAETLSRYPAVRLFVDRAAAARSGFNLNAENAGAIAEICQRLDGIPLAIELAAARVRVLSVDSIAVRLNDCFTLLTGGSRTALRRHQTLRALIDWSHDLLSDRERSVFRRLSVFAGGWTLEAAESVCCEADIAESEVLGILADLVDKSLVIVVPEQDRYRLLETIRQYAGERLTKTGELDLTRSRHLAYFLEFSEKVAPELLGPQQAAGLKRLDVERENILGAHSWCLGRQDRADSDHRLVHAIKHYWFIRGQLDVGHRVTVEAVQNGEGAGPSLARCKALWVAGQISCTMGRYDEASRYLEESLQLAREFRDTRMIVSVLNVLTPAALGQGDRAAARRHCEEALQLANDSGNKRQIATASNALAQICRVEGELTLAEPLYQRTVTLGREIGDHEVEAVAFLNLAMVAIERGNVRNACELLGQVLIIAEETASKPAGQSALSVFAGLAALAADWEQAARFYGMAERQTGHTGIQRDPTDDAFLQPLIAKTRDALGNVAFDAARASGGALDFEQGVEEARVWLPRVG